ncbi:MAG: serine hydrolase [Planctomycetota bacterium]|nr:MAG: serine hydrolase [Planctomycetota bacterium]
MRGSGSACGARAPRRAARGLAGAICVLVLAAGTARAQPQQQAPAEPDPLLEAAGAVAAAIAPTPSAELARHFGPHLLAALPWERLAALTAALHERHGAVERLELLEREGGKGRFLFHLQDGAALPVTIVLKGEPGRIEGLWFGVARPRADSVAAVLAELAALPGQPGAAVLEVGARPEDDAVLHALAAERRAALGSACKLYVLGALLDEIAAGRRRWDEVVQLSEAHRSLPSGLLQDWPAGTPVTVASLAALMIARSDNTATDQLLALLGRERLEAQLARMGHGAPARTLPWLATRELFLLRGDQALARRYREADLAGRRALLQALGGRMPDPGSLPVQPQDIDAIEWFASPRELCAAMAWLWRRTAEQELALGRALLAINPGPAAGEQRDWRYAGFKGGSEPGVLCLALLLQHRGGRTFAVAASWNDPQRALDEQAFVALCVRLLHALAVELEAAGRGAAGER